jgi:hypothetical protein
VRYAFHGKVRATGQQVDGFVDAPNSADAIDQLADQGIIGVQTVRPAPLPGHVQALLGHSDGSENGAPEFVLTQLVDKLTSLVGQVEKILSRPMMISGPARSSNASAQRHPANAAQNAALKAIFETNLDLRKSLEKLAHAAASIRPANGSAKADGAPAESSGPMVAAPAREPTVHPAAPVSPMPREIASHPVAPPRERPAVHAQPAA